VLAAFVTWRASIDAPLLFEGLLGATWSIPVQAWTATIAGAAILALATHRVALARLLIMLQVSLVLLGWGLAMNGHLVLPDMHLHDAGASEPVLAALPWVLLGGALVFVPALMWLYRVFVR
jgi:cytochrome d ubiquinol oxidase subunit II